jgi:hypothetical protein
VRGGAPIWGGQAAGAQSDVVPEGLQLAAQVAGRMVVVEALVVEVRPEIVEPRGAVGEELPGGDEDGSGDGYEGFLLPAAQLVVSFPKQRTEREGPHLLGGARLGQQFSNLVPHAFGGHRLQVGPMFG